MATYPQRWAMVCEGLLGRPATVAEQTKLGDAIASANPLDLSDYATFTNAQKAEACVKYAKRHFVGLVKQKSRQDALVSAQQTEATIDAEFVEPTG